MFSKIIVAAVMFTASAGMTAVIAQEGGAGMAPGAMGGPPAGGPDFTAAAETLGVSLEDLNAAMHEAMVAAGGPPTDLSGVAEKLGVDEAALKSALPPPPDHGG